jgi:predicted MarR family transcription regulator
MSEIDRSWHLAQTEDEIKVAEFELQLWRTFNAFLHWAEECERCVNNTGLNGYDLSVLHIIRMKDRSKSINDIVKILNRNDTFNVQYSIKKLIKMDLIKKDKTSLQHKRAASYSITGKGIQNTDAYTTARRKILIEQFIKNVDLTLEEMTKTVTKLKTIYNEAEQLAASYVIPDKSNVE